ncbi:hypothetical protein ABIA16_003585 [Sinorhizobium fredii]
MIGKMATAACIVFIVMVIASCATTIPDMLLTCKDEPRYTGRSNVSAADLLEFTDRVAVAGADCRAKVNAIRKIEKAN